MDFVFEGVKRGRSSVSSSFDPGHPAVRVKFYQPKNSPGRIVIRFSFSKSAVELARWMKGDRLEAGFDAANGLVAFKRSPHTGYLICGTGFSDSDKKSANGLAGFQLSTSHDGPIAMMLAPKQNTWVRVSASGVLMVTERLVDQVNA